jgi:hypothetical protein
MKLRIILIITLLLISTGFFSGCNQEKNNHQIDTNKLELVNYTVEIRDDLTGKEYRKITGFVENNAGIFIKMVEIEIMFYDINDNLLRSKFSYINDLDNKDTKQFSNIYHSLDDNYKKVNWDNIKFEISIYEF